MRDARQGLRAQHTYGSNLSCFQNTTPSYQDNQISAAEKITEDMLMVSNILPLDTDIWKLYIKISEHE